MQNQDNLNTIEQQFMESYDEFSDAIFRHCYFKLSDRDHAKDTMQETFIRAWKYMSEGKEIENIRAFLYRVANNLIIDSYRKKKEDSLDSMQAKGFDPEGDSGRRLDDQLSDKQLLKLLDDLDPGYREAIIMRYIDDLSPKEIAEINQEKENAVSVRIHRGLKKAKELISSTINDN